MKGKVKWYNPQKGYGFIEGEDKEDYFVHISALPPRIRLNEGDDVTFEAHDTQRGKQARDVAQVGAAGKKASEETDDVQESDDESVADESDDVQESDDEEPAEDESSDDSDFDEEPEDDDDKK